MQNIQFELLASEMSRPDNNPAPGMLCTKCQVPTVCTSPTNCAPQTGAGTCGATTGTSATSPSGCCTYDEAQRHGWVRLTQDQAGRRYHLYFCTPHDGWVAISGGPNDGAGG
eukprot:COSAG05_NODE_3378_length_2100_cov_3.102319_3_plen_112_part_00